MTQLNPMKTAKRWYAAMGATDLAARSGLDRSSRLTVQLRASYVNGCRYCIDMHTEEARKAGWTDGDLARIRDWDGPSGGDAGEELLLELTDAGCRLADRDDAARAAVEDLRERAVRSWGEKRTTAAIAAIAAIATINAWNRVGVLGGL